MARKFILTLCLLLSACSVTPPVPASTATSTDPEFDHAVQQARDSLDEFIERIASPHPTPTIVAVKVRFFPPDASPQDVWVDGVTYTDDSLHGNMGDDIPSLRLSFGDPILIPTKNILDWMIVEDGKLIGGYTIRLAYKRMPPAEKERFLESLDYSIDD